jgi:hypothetical protein
MRRRLILFSFLVVLGATVPVLTITNGQPDGNAHPYVGLAFQPIPSMPGFVTICSGSALSATVFLTAAHCFDPARPVSVTYSANPLGGGATIVTGTFTPHPSWCLGCGPGLPGFDSRDVAVIELSTPLNPGEFVQLPSAGFVDTLPMRTPVSVVGYGVQVIERGGGPPSGDTNLQRYFAPTRLVQSNHSWSSEFIKLTANPAGGKGGICFGDSGGPDVLEGNSSGTDTVLAVNSYVTNSNCAGVTYSNRLDLPDVLSFIASVLNPS